MMMFGRIWLGGAWTLGERESVCVTMCVVWSERPMEGDAGLDGAAIGIVLRRVPVNTVSGTVPEKQREREREGGRERERDGERERRRERETEREREREG